ncbi:MAG: hypothetical protein RLZZ135_972 [Cyanobacteriota bacterium]|jgi:molybdopterin-guanine dinucleotide biosynthesis protein A
MMNAVKTDWLCAIVLAGGRSTRMGRDKATIEVGGIPMLRRIYDSLALCHDRGDQLADCIYIVTPDLEKYRSILPVNCHFIGESSPHQGPLFGFVQALTAISSTWVLLLACDLPYLSTEVVQTWIDGLGLIPADSVAYLPKHPTKGWEPLCGFYRCSCLESLLEYINTGGRSFQGWLAKNPVTELQIADPMCLVNCNTPVELANVVEHYSIGIKW